MKVGYYQFKPEFGKVELNRERILAAISNSSARLIVLPELALTGYNFKDREEALNLSEEAETGSSIKCFIQSCRENKQYMVFGFAERGGEQLYNSAALVGPDGYLAIYRKLHLFGEEKNIFDAGNMPLKTEIIDGVKIGIMICFDWYFPEVTRKLALSGAQIICHPSNLVLSYCQQAMITRCLENKVFAITANRTGSENRQHRNIRFTGKSQVTGPDGRILHRSKNNREELFIMDIDAEQANNKWMTEQNHAFKDRRPEFY